MQPKIEPIPEPTQLERELAKLNAAFDVNFSKESVANGSESCERYLDFIKHNSPESDWPILMHNSTEYAMYLLGRKHGLLEQSDLLLPFGSVKSRILEIIGA